jgi:2-hydroxychromene-2-carboxylate isomerase
VWRDLERVCAGLGHPFRRPSTFPHNGLLAARIACRFEGESWLPEFARKVFAANFADDRDISDRAILGAIVDELGLPKSIVAEAESPQAKSALRTPTERAGALGLFGAPSFTIAGELFWGNDRLEDARPGRRGTSQARPGIAVRPPSCASCRQKKARLAPGFFVTLTR